MASDNHYASRYATAEEAMASPFRAIIETLNNISGAFNLPDHRELNRQRYPWATFLRQPEFYASRAWEYPWAITEAHLEPGMKCADVGCGQSPLTIYLKNEALCDVVGFDPEV